MVRISLFGLPGTGTSSVGRATCEKLNYEFQSSGNMYRALAMKHNMTVDEFGIYCKKNLESDKELDDSIIKYGKENDNFVFDSRLAWFTIPHSFKIKLICNEDERIRRIIERDGGDFGEEKEKAKIREEANCVRYKELYNIENYSLDSHFDLIIDTTDKSIEEVVDLITERIE